MSHTECLRILQLVIRRRTALRVHVSIRAVRVALLRRFFRKVFFSAILCPAYLQEKQRNIHDSQ